MTDKTDMAPAIRNIWLMAIFMILVIIAFVLTDILQALNVMAGLR